MGANILKNQTKRKEGKTPPNPPQWRGLKKENPTQPSPMERAKKGKKEMVTINEKILESEVFRVTLVNDDKEVQFLGKTANKEVVSVTLKKEELQSAFELLNDTI